MNTIPTILSMPDSWAQSKLFYQCQTTERDLRVYWCQSLGTISTILSMPITGHDLNCSINAKPLSAISECIDVNHWSRSQLFYHCQTTGHDLNCSINAKPLGMFSESMMLITGHDLREYDANHWVPSQPFYQCQTTGHNLKCSINVLGTRSKLIYQCQTTGDDLINYRCQTTGHNLK